MQQKYYKFEVNLIYMNILALVLYILFFLGITILYPESIAKLYTGSGFWIFISLLFLYFAIHELFHGIGYSLFARNRQNIKYGIIIEKGVFYAMCQELINKKATIISLLMPIIFLSIIPWIICLFFELPILFILAGMNFIGAIGDFTMLFLLLKLPDVSYIDYDNSIGMYLISNQDISKYRFIGIKCVDSGIHDERLIDKSIKRIYISRPSKIFFIILILFLIINLVRSVL